MVQLNNFENIPSYRHRTELTQTPYIYTVLPQLLYLSHWTLHKAPALWLALLPVLQAIQPHLLLKLYFFLRSLSNVCNTFLIWKLLSIMSQWPPPPAPAGVTDPSTDASAQASFHFISLHTVIGQYPQLGQAEPGNSNCCCLLNIVPSNHVRGIKMEINTVGSLVRLLLSSSLKWFEKSFCKYLGEAPKVL